MSVDMSLEEIDESYRMSIKDAFRLMIAALFDHMFYEIYRIDNGHTNQSKNLFVPDAPFHES